jgi:catechol 2,3-dioxygenase-like lactoylglutathione lyase family enzyme
MGLPANGTSSAATRLQALAVSIKGETEWPHGGMSFYFRDHDGHLVELATCGRS